MVVSDLSYKWPENCPCSIVAFVWLLWRWVNMTIQKRVTYFELFKLIAKTSMAKTKICNHLFHIENPPNQSPLSKISHHRSVWHVCRPHRGAVKPLKAHVHGGGPTSAKQLWRSSCHFFFSVQLSQRGLHHSTCLCIEGIISTVSVSGQQEAEGHDCSVLFKDCRVSHSICCICTRLLCRCSVSVCVRLSANWLTLVQVRKLQPVRGRVHLHSWLYLIPGSWGSSLLRWLVLSLLLLLLLRKILQ